MAFKVRVERDLAIVEASSELDIFTAPQFRRACTRAIEAGHDVAIDLSRVRFIDSAGLGVIVGTLKRVRAREGQLSLICDNPKVLGVLKMTGLIKVFTIHPSMDALNTSRA